MTSTHPDAANESRSAQPRDRLVRSSLPLSVAAGWIGFEFVLRRGVVPRLAPLLGDPLVADWTAMVLGVPLIAAVLGWVATTRGRPPGGWGYDWSRRPVVAGIIGIVVAIVVLAVTSQIDAFLFPLERVGAAVGTAIGEVVRATPALALLFLVGNGLVVPIAEEAVWRGIVQTDLVDAWGPVGGVALTAALFALKHVIVDLSLVRITTLLALGVVLGVLRHRYGTASSTITHVGVNAISSASFIAVALA